jgi:hypothetical protein
VSFKERMQRVASMAELRGLMEELAVQGSPNWTWESASQFVPSDLWGELALYFDGEGRLRVPSGDALPPQARERGRYGSLAERIGAVHLRLANARAGGWQDPEPREQRSRPSAVMEAAEQEVRDDCRADNVLPSNDADEHAVTSAAIQLFCPICELPYDTEPVSYRGTEMCGSCADLVRVN